MRCLFLLVLSIAALLSGGCGSDKANTAVIVEQNQNVAQSQTAVRKNVALVMKTLTNPFFIEMEKGARRGAQEFGVNLVLRTGAQETSIAQQIEIIDELVRAKVDAIVIAPASSAELIPALKKAQDAQIKIINIDNRLDHDICEKIGLRDVPFISVDNERGAYLAAQHLSRKIATPTEAVVLEGIVGADNAKARRDGALRAFRENPNIHVVAVKTANWKIDEAYDVTKNLYRQYPDIGLLVCGNDMMALGAAKYLADSSRSNVLVGGYDALEEAKRAIQSGTIAVTVDQQAELQGYLGVKAAVQKMNGESVEREILVDVRIIERANLP